MSIKIYETQIRPTGETGAVKTQPGQRISMDTATQIGRAVKGAAKVGIEFWKELEVKKSENEYYEKRKKLEEGDDTFEGMISVKEKASRESDPDRAAKIYNEGLANAKQILGAKYEHRYTKQIFEKELKKKEIADGIEVRKKSNANFLAKSQTLELQELERLKKEIVYGETAEARLLAKFELDYKLNQDKTKNLFGAKHELLKKNTYADVEFYKAKRAIDQDATAGLAAAKKNKNITIENYEKLVTYAKKKSTLNSETYKSQLKTIESQVDQYVLPDAETINQIEKSAIASGDTKTLKKINDLKIKTQVVAALKTMTYEELQQAKNTALRVQQGADPEEFTRANIVKNYVNKINKDLKDDQIEAAKKIGVFNDVSEINVTSFLNQPQGNEDFDNAIQNRVVNANAIAKFYGKPVKYFSESELGQLQEYFAENRNKEHLKRVLSGLNKSFGPNAPAVFREIAKKNPFFGYLGGLINQTGPNSESVSRALKGFELSKNKDIAPLIKKGSGNMARLNTLKTYREAYAKNTDTFEIVEEAAEYIYMSMLYEKGETGAVFKPNLYKKALEMASGKRADGRGGVGDYAGNKIVLPSFMNEEEFAKGIEKLKNNPELLKKAAGDVLAKGISPKDGSARDIDIFKNNPNPVFINVGNGRYVISLTNHPHKGKPDYVMTPGYNFDTNQAIPYVIDFNKIKDDLED